MKKSMGEEKKKINIKRFFSHLTVWDCAALAVFIGAVIWYCIELRLGVAAPDESFYYSIPQRMAMGDRLLVDEWHVSQLSALLQYIPYRLFTLVTGSTQGIILFMRFFAAAVASALYWFVYVKLREYRLFGLVAALPFVFWFPGSVFALSYFTLSYYTMTVVCMVLFMGKRPPVPFWKLILTGVLFSCSVLSQPVFAVIYLIFTVLCWVRFFKPHFLKNYDFIIDVKMWKGLTLGCLISFVLVVGNIAIKSGVSNIIQTIPELFTDTEYQLTSSELLSKVFRKINEAMGFYGTWFIFGALLCCVAAAFAQRKNSKIKAYKKIIFLCAAVFFAAQIINALVFLHIRFVQERPDISFYFYYFSVPTSFLGLVCYLLCDKKEPRFLVIWCISFLMSLLCSITSDIYMSISASLNHIVLLCCLKELADEYAQRLQRSNSSKKQSVSALNKAKKAQRERKGFRIACALIIVLLISWTFCNDYVQAFIPLEPLVYVGSESKLSETIDRGPLKGIKTTPAVKREYENALSDLDTIAADSDGKPFYLVGLNPQYYLYLDLPFGTYSTWYVEADSETRQLRYWKMHPEKRPKYVYISNCYYYFRTNVDDYEMTAKDHIEGKLKLLQSICQCTYTKGRAGYIVKIEKWK